MVKEEGGMGGYVHPLSWISKPMVYVDISLNFELFISSWNFCKLLNLSEGLLWMFSEMVRGGGGGGREEANIRPFPIVLGNFWATFWRLEQLFAVLATSSKLAFLSNFWANFRFRAHIKYEKVKNCIENFSSCECLECLSIFFYFSFFFNFLFLN